MKSRKPVFRSRDRKIFSRTASRTHVKNIPGAKVYRGGIRL